MAFFFFLSFVDGDGLQGPVLNIDGSEFWFVPNKHLSFQEAALYCSNNGSDLASVASFTALTGILNRIANVIYFFVSWIYFVVKMSVPK